jgi:hypothetical protein
MRISCHISKTFSDVREILHALFLYAEIPLNRFHQQLLLLLLLLFEK